MLLRVWLGGSLDGSLEAVNPCKSLQEQLRGSQLDAKQLQLEEEDLRVPGEEEGAREEDSGAMGCSCPKERGTGWARLEVALLAGGGGCEDPAGDEARRAGPGQVRATCTSRGRPR